MSQQAGQKDLAALLSGDGDASALAAHLDGLDAQERIRQVQALSRSLLPTLYERCEKSPPLTLEDMVPASISAGQTVIFAGLNNLPMFRMFQKRFTRTKTGAIVGFNFQTMSPFTGPGYFTVIPVGAELDFDYTQIPVRDAVPAGWPAVQANDRGLSLTHFIYKGLHDFCRRVSRDVVIGHATRDGKSLPQYFALARHSVQ